MRTGIYQNNPCFGEVEKNLEQAIDAIKGIQADLVVLPELFSTGYQFISKEEAMELSEEIPSGPSCEKLIEFARIKKIFMVFGIAERQKDQLFNSAVLIGPDGFIGKYRKAHLFFEEKLFFDPGDTGFKVYDIGIARLGIMICFDWWFPEAARTLALNGADIICHPANLVLQSCQRSMVIRSLENAVYTVTANRIGSESRGGKEELVFTGESQLLSPGGERLLGLSRGKEEISVVDIDVKKARDKSITSFNDRFKDRRPELYYTI